MQSGRAVLEEPEARGQRREVGRAKSIENTRRRERGDRGERIKIKSTLPVGRSMPPPRSSGDLDQKHQDQLYKLF